MNGSPSTRAAGLVFALGGTLLAGVVTGLPEGPRSMLEHALGLPAIVFGVAALMLPSLYIVAARLGVAAPAGEFGAAAVEASAKFGLVLLGFAAPLAFLVATSSLFATVFVLTNLVLALASLVAVRALWYALFARMEPRPMVLFLVWAAIGLAIAEHLFMGTFFS